MFENLTGRLSEAAKTLSGKGRITESNVKDTLRQVRLALLEADVALPVVKSFIDRIREQAVGEAVSKSLTPGQALLKIIHNELVSILGDTHTPIDLRAQPPVVILLAGLQGAGKTTTAAKLAKRLIEKEKKRVMLVSVDVYRPAAILQLETLAGEVGALHCASSTDEKPEAIVTKALDEARRSAADVLIVDTAGRLHVDDGMMQEVVSVHARSGATETLFIVDSMAGQDAVNAATAFNQSLPLTGIILTKADGDAKGGVALSVREITGKPIRFMGVGEKVDALEAFHPERMASRILGMGDVLSLVEEIEDKVNKEKTEKVDALEAFHPERMASRILGMGDVLSLVEEIEDKVNKEKTEKLAKKLKKGRGFDLSDLKDQLEQMMNMGGMAAMLDKLPLPGNVNPAALKDSANEKQLKRQVAIINSMTPGERQFPKTINGSRKKRIATGAGLQIQDVNRLLKQFTQMEKMMRKMSRGGMKKMMRGMSAGGMPPGLR